MSGTKVLKTVTDSFSLFRSGRKFGANERQYIVKSVQNVLNNPEVIEKMQLGEMYGYWGHGRREAVGRIDVRETEVVHIDGKAVVYDNVPSHRTISCICNDDGTVEHTEEIFTTIPGESVSKAVDDSFGGWSWATSGDSSRGFVRAFSGFDYVLRPNYLSLNHSSMMLESAGNRNQMMLESMRSIGLSDKDAQVAISRLSNDEYLVERFASFESEQMMLEGMLSETREQYSELDAKYHNSQTKINELTEASNKRTVLMLESLNAMPFYLTDEQKQALASMQTDHDKQVVQLMFESLSSGKLQTLPMGKGSSDSTYVNRPREGRVDMSNAVDMRPNRRRFS